MPKQLTTEQLCIQKDQKLRRIIRDIGCIEQTESEIIYDIITKNLFKYTYPYLYEYEWEVVPNRPQKGKGDLVFTDGKQSFLIVECKYINQNSGKTARIVRRNKRRKVERQAISYALKYAQRNPAAILIGYVHITNEDRASMETARARIQYL